MSRNVTELGDPLIQDLGDGSLVFEQLEMRHEGYYLCEIKGARMSSQTLLTVVDMSDEGIGEWTEVIILFQLHFINSLSLSPSLSLSLFLSLSPPLSLSLSLSHLTR